MQIFYGKNSGFCFGVKRAIEKATELAKNDVFLLGDIIHNEIVNESLAKKGLIKIDSVFDERLKSGSTLIIRTHGEPKSTFDFLKEKNINIVDLTCPFVKDIQNIVRKHYLDGYSIVIIGDKNHPEVKGINGWCDNTAFITNDEILIDNFLAQKICIVVQTTFCKEKFENIIKKISNDKSKTVDIFKTICYTTNMRQIEAENISKKCDAVLVLGGSQSNNTQELFNISSKYCKNVFRIVSPKSFDYALLKNYNKVGIVFGASTPSEQFMEVISQMEKNTEVVAVKELDDVKKESKVVKSDMEKAFNDIKPRDFKVGQIVTAKISSAKDDGLTISIKNIKNDFDLSKDEMLNSYNKEEYKDKIGQEIKVMVIAKNPVKFSEKAMEKVIAEEADIATIKDGRIFEAVIKATNKGGLVGQYGSYQVFVPSSQIRVGFVKDLEKYVGKTLRLKAEKVESKGARRQIVASQRIILEAEKQEREAARVAIEEEFFANVQVDDVILGKPVRFTSFGAFIDVNGFDCLAHISDLSWYGCKDCAEVLELGKQYEFKVLKIDTEAKKVSVGYKQLQPKPWDTVLERYKVGDVIKGKIVRKVSFGAFVEVEKGIDGLVHVSEISNKWVENPVSTLTEGQEVDVKILGIDPEKEKMTLSIKALLEAEPQAETTEEVADKPAKGKKRTPKKDENGDVELREWKEDSDVGTSIGDLINK